MELRKIVSKKSFKLLALLIVSLLIASASAAVYYSMIMQPTVSISQASIIFFSGSDFPAGSTMGTNSTWVSLALKAYPNVTLTYDQPLNVSNTDSASHQFRLRHISITPTSGQAQVNNFTFINFIVLNTLGVTQATFSYNTTGTTWNLPTSTSYLTLPASTQWVISVQTQAAAGANTAAVASIQISVDTQ